VDIKYSVDLLSEKGDFTLDCGYVDVAQAKALPASST